MDAGFTAENKSPSSSLMTEVTDVAEVKDLRVGRKDLGIQARSGLKHCTLAAIGIVGAVLLHTSMAALIANPVGLAVIGVISFISVLTLICTLKKSPNPLEKPVKEEWQSLLKYGLLLGLSATGIGAVAGAVYYSATAVIAASGLTALVSLPSIINQVTDSHNVTKNNDQKYAFMKEHLECSFLDQDNLVDPVKGYYTEFAKKPSRENWGLLIESLMVTVKHCPVVDGEIIVGMYQQEMDACRELSTAIFSVNLQDYYSEFVDTFNTGSVENCKRGKDEITGIESFMKQSSIAKFVGTQWATIKQQIMGEHRNDVFMSNKVLGNFSRVFMRDNLPTFVEKQKLEGYEIPMYRQPNPTISLDDGETEEIDPIFKLHLEALEGKNKCCFYTCLLDPSKSKKEYLGIDALKAAEGEVTNFHLLTQSMDHNLYMEEYTGTKEEYSKELIRMYEYEDDPHFKLPNFLQKDLINRELYVHELKEKIEQLNSDLGVNPNSQFKSKEEKQAYCQLFYAVQRDHLKVFISREKQQIGHCTVACKDDADRGGAMKASEMMLHHFQDPKGKSDGQFLQELFIKTTGATQVSVARGALEKRFNVVGSVWNMLESACSNEGLVRKKLVIDAIMEECRAIFDSSSSLGEEEKVQRIGKFIENITNLGPQFFGSDYFTQIMAVLTCANNKSTKFLDFSRVIRQVEEKSQFTERTVSRYEYDTTELKKDLASLPVTIEQMDTMESKGKSKISMTPEDVIKTRCIVQKIIDEAFGPDENLFYLNTHKQETRDQFGLKQEGETLLQKENHKTSLHIVGDKSNNHFSLPNNYRGMIVSYAYALLDDVLLEDDNPIEVSLPVFRLHLEAINAASGEYDKAKQLEGEEGVVAVLAEDEAEVVALLAQSKAEAPSAELETRNMTHEAYLRTLSPASSVATDSDYDESGSMSGYSTDVFELDDGSLSD